MNDIPLAGEAQAKPPLRYIREKIGEDPIVRIYLDQQRKRGWSLEEALAVAVDVLLMSQRAAAKAAQTIKFTMPNGDVIAGLFTPFPAPAAPAEAAASPPTPSSTPSRSRPIL